MAIRNWKKPSYNNSEQQLKRVICDWLARQRETVVLMYPSFRGTTRADGSRVVYSSIYMPPGVSDILACWRGRWVAIEVKRPKGAQKALPGIPVKPQAKGVLSAHQEYFLERVRRAGGLAIVAYSLDDVIRAFEEAQAQDALKPQRSSQGGEIHDPT